MTHYRIVSKECTIKTGWDGTKMKSEGFVNSDDPEAGERMASLLAKSLERTNERLYEYCKEGNK
jgi:uncharacterized protein (DUF736 family)